MILSQVLLFKLLYAKINSPKDDLVLPKWRSSKVQRISDETDCYNWSFVVTVLQTHDPDTVSDNDKMNKTQNLT